MKHVMSVLLCSVFLLGCYEDVKRENENWRIRYAQWVQDSTNFQREIERLERDKATAESYVMKLEGDMEFVVEEFRKQMSDEGVPPSTMTGEPQRVNIFTRDLALWGANTRRLRLDLAQAEQELQEFMSESWVVAMRQRNDELKTEADALRASNSELDSNLRYTRGELSRVKQTSKELDEQLTAEIARRQEVEDEAGRFKGYLEEERERVEYYKGIAGVVTKGGCLAEGRMSSLVTWGVVVKKRRLFKDDIFQIHFSPDYVGTCKME